MREERSGNLLVDVYNLNDYLVKTNLKHEDVQLKLHGCDGRIAIVKSKSNNEAIAIDNEGCFQGVCNGSVELSVNKVPVKNSQGQTVVSIFAIGTIEVTIEEIENECTKKEIQLKDFVRTFGDRLDRNYYNILEYLNSNFGFDIEF